MKVTVQVKYFALLKELAGKPTEEMTVTEGDRASHLYMRLAEQYAFPLGLADIRVAVNNEFTTTEHPLRGGDQVVFIPPVAGG